MAIVETYVDPSIAADSGAGTIGDPYGDLEYALEQTTPGTDGDRFNIKAGTAEVLAVELGAAIAVYGTPTAAAQLVFQGYTSAQGDGGIGEISGGASVSIIDAATLDYVHFIDLKIGNCGSNAILSLDDWNSVIRCELHTSSHTTPVILLSENNIIDCYFHTFTTATANSKMLRVTADCLVKNCFFDGGTGDWEGAIATASALNFIENNIVHLNNADAIGIYAFNRSNRVIGNSVFNETAGTESGITLGGGSNGHACLALNNIIEGWNGTGGSAIEGSGNAPAIVAGNIEYACTDGNTWVDEPLLYEANTVADASPFTAADEDDFTVTTEAQAAAFVQVFRGAASSTNIEDAGACQRLESGGTAIARALLG